MGYYLQIDQLDQKELASISGWGDVCKWAATLPKDDSEELKHFCQYGWTQAIPEMKEEIEKCLKAHKPSHDVVSTLENLINNLVKDATLATVTDGLSK